MATPSSYVGNTTNEMGAFPNNQRADIMRKSMENKNILSAKGSIYAGTGRTNTTDGNTTAETKALEAGLDGQILMVDSNEETGLKYINPSNLQGVKAATIAVNDGGVISYKSLWVVSSLPQSPSNDIIYFVRES